MLGFPKWVVYRIVYSQTCVKQPVKGMEKIGCLKQVPTNNLNCRANYGLVNLWSNFNNCNTDLHIGKTIFQ